MRECIMYCFGHLVELFITHCTTQLCLMRDKALVNNQSGYDTSSHVSATGVWQTFPNYLTR